MEFLASFSMDKKGIDYVKLGVIEFRLGCKDFAFSISEFGVALGLYRETFVGIELYQNSLSHDSSSRARAFWHAHAKPRVSGRIRAD